jgi:peroxiredoxin
MARSRDALLAEFQARADRNDNAGALASLLELIALDGATDDRLLWKHQLLSDLGRHVEALDAALEFERVAGRKSPFNYVRIAESHLALEHTEEAFDWLERATDERGFRHARLFQHEPFDALVTHPRYRELVAMIEKNTGVGTVLPDFAVELLDGTRLRLSSLRGSVVLVDFWATICLPCVDEMPNLRRLYERYGRREFTILGISLDSDLDTARTFLAEHEIAWPNACSGDRWADRTAKLLNVHATPSVWLVDRAGVACAFDLRGDDLVRAVAGLATET